MIPAIIKNLGKPEISKVNDMSDICFILSDNDNVAVKFRYDKTSLIIQFKLGLYNQEKTFEDSKKAS